MILRVRVLTRCPTRRIGSKTTRVDALCSSVWSAADKLWRPHRHRQLVMLLDRSLSNPQFRQFVSTTARLDEAAPSQHTRATSVPRLSLARTDPLHRQIQQFLDVPVGQLRRHEIVHVIPLLIDKCFRWFNSTVAIQEAQDLVERVIREKHARGGIPDLLPAALVEKLLYGYVQCVQQGALDLAEYNYAFLEVLYLMIAESENDNRMGYDAPPHVCQVTTRTLNIALRGYVKLAQQHPRLAAKEAMRIFSWMQAKQQHYRVKPDNITYTMLMTLYRKDPAQARRVMEWMKEQHGRDKKEYETQYRVPYDMANPSKNQSFIVIPDLAAFSALISAFRSTDAEMVEQLWREMMNKGIHPDAIVLTNVIWAWGAKAAALRNAQLSHDNAAHAEDLLWKMVDYAKQNKLYTLSSENALYPTIFTFNACLGNWAKSNSKEAVYRAESLLQRMLDDDHQNESSLMVTPNRMSFDTVLNAWSRAAGVDPQSGRHAEELLDRMYSLSEQGVDCEPDLNSYTAAIVAWSRTESRDRVRRARALLDRMLEKDKAGRLRNKPDILPFAAVIQAADRRPEFEIESADTPFASFSDITDDGSEAYLIALRTYSELSNDLFQLGISPDHMVYAAVIAVVGKFTSSKSGERRQLIEQIFTRARKAGEVSGLVVVAMRRVCPTHDLLDRLFPCADLALNMTDVRELPASWTRKVTNPRFRRVGKNKQKPKKPKPNS